MSAPFGDFYRGKTVLVTGHTGFKGSWLSIWLGLLGARLVGYSLEPPSEPGIFEACRMRERVTHIHGDVLDYEHLAATVDEHRPQVVFHLAAQSLVRRSFVESRHTFDVNLMGTVNVLDAALRAEGVDAVVTVTSDKCYRNVGWEWGYRETDPLGGQDAYSASKACAELAVAAYQAPGFQSSVGRRRRLPVASARAGNVIGGGDWAAERLVPDTVRAIVEHEPITLRYPTATRPWQHVLDPISGYLWLAACLVREPDRFSTAWNFGPADGAVYSVRRVVEEILAQWPGHETEISVRAESSSREALLLGVDCSKARQHLGWTATWRIDETIAATTSWYREFYRDEGEGEMYAYSVAQIHEYTRAAVERDLAWAAGTEEGCYS